ncbi:MAG: hypothetical protein H6631_18890 [Anaerolineaceae bacterium]|nr:hypothetical protein [Anaerolineaceae bacterium]MCB9098609.1 hypothetical protein [Anaerolineales bacterium]
MSQQKNSAPMFAVCIDNSEYPASLELHKVYQVLPDEEAAVDGDLRVIDESGEDYLYPADYFILVKLPQEVEQAFLQTTYAA